MCANSHVNLHEIRTKFIIFGKLGKSSYEFAQIHEGYVMNGLYCTCPERQVCPEYFQSNSVTNMVVASCMEARFYQVMISKFMYN